MDKIYGAFFCFLILLSEMSNKNYKKMLFVFAMKCFFRECDLVLNNSTEIYDLTDEVINYVAESRIKNGHVLVQSMHAAMGVCLNENAPANRCNNLGLRVFFNSSLSLIIFGGKLQLGESQKILLGELDGLHSEKRGEKRRYIINVIGA